MTSLPAPPADYKACCADLWAHPMVPVLIGDSFRPGGLDLTRAVLDRLDVAPGDRVLDVGCGPGTTVAHCAELGLDAIGVDLSLSHRPRAVADSELLPFATGAFDGVLMECVLSAFPDKAAALAEAHRVLRPGGRIGLTDVTLAGSFPEPLDSLIAWVACVGGALTADGYRTMLHDAGFDVVEVSDHGADLGALVNQVRRRFALIQGAIGVGLTPDLELPPGADLAELGQTALAQLAAAIETGDLGYAGFLASRR